MSARLVVFALAAILMFRGGSAAEAASLNPTSDIDKSSLGAFVERPLFDPARRLPPPPPPPADVVVQAPAPPVAEPPPSLQLVGIVQGTHNLAVVHRNGDGKTVVLRNGERLGDWTVVVTPLRVTLRNGSRSASYSILVANSAFRPPRFKSGSLSR